MSVTIDDFHIKEQLGRGRFGQVYKVVKKDDSSKIYALKVIFKQEMIDQGILQQLMKEIEIQSKVKHKYILRLRYVSQDHKRVYLFTDLANQSNLYHYIHRVKHIPEYICGKYIRQLLNALIYLHQHHIIHRDIKPENILLSPSGNLLLGDFGWSTFLDGQGRDTICGTLDYFPPEMLNKQVYNETVDTWACGVLCYEILTGFTPFLGLRQEEKFAKIVTGTYTCPAFFSDGVKHFLSCALRVDPTKRYSAGELFLLPWTQSQNEDGMSIEVYERSIATAATMLAVPVSAMDDDAFLKYASSVAHSDDTM